MGLLDIPSLLLGNDLDFAGLPQMCTVDQNNKVLYYSICSVQSL